MALVELTGHTESPNSIYIKFPAVKDVDGIEKNAAKFQQILTQVILDQEIGGSIKKDSVENGSIWFKVIVGTQLAVQLIGALCNSAALLMRESKQVQYIEQYIKEKKIENEEKETYSNFKKGLLISISKTKPKT